MRYLSLCAVAVLAFGGPAAAQDGPSPGSRIGGESETGAGPASEAGAETVRADEAGSGAASETETESETESGSETETESASETETESGSETETETETESESETDSETESESESGYATESESGSESESESESESVSATESESGSETVPAAESEPAAGDERAGEPRGPCDSNLRSRPVGPLQVGELDGFLAVPHRACPRREVAVGGNALLVADEAAFYGKVRVDARARISAPLFDPRVEMFLSWEALRYQTVISSVAAEYLGLGYLAWGAAGQVYLDEERVVAVTGRMVLPTTTGLDQGGQPLALDVGVTAAHRVDPHLRVHAWLTLLGSVGIGGPAEPRGGLRLGGGFDWQPLEWLGVVVELQSGFGYRDALDLVAAQAGIRLALGTELGLEVAASLPLLGTRAIDDGALPISASLMLAWRIR